MATTRSASLGGITYNIGQSMVRRGKPLPLVIKVVAFVVAFALWLPIAPVWYLAMLNKRISQPLAAIFVPRVMPMMDKAFREVKLELLKGLHGRVLDVGCGAGDWLKYFAKATSVTELEPNPFLIPKIMANVEKFKQEHPEVQVEVACNYASELDPAKPYDYVIFGNVMCEVPDQIQFLHDIDRVLKPGGKIVFQEHVKEDDGSLTALFQEAFNPWWRVASDGCNCNRKTVLSLATMKNWRILHWDLNQDGPLWLSRMAVGIIEKEGATGSTSTAKM